MEFDFDSLSLQELKNLRTRIEKSIQTFEERKKKQALAEVEDVARRLGYSLTDLADSIAKKRSAVGAKYANPANRDQTWSGRGRKPQWFEAALKSGKTLDDLAV